MKKIIVAVGSIRKPKLRAVTEALNALAPKLVPDGDFEVVGVEVESAVSSTPFVGRTDARSTPAREALALLARDSQTVALFVGLEGGLEVLQVTKKPRLPES
jgi:non-canonical (house-cleaning) NTP pyrophosphatase